VFRSAASTTIGFLLIGPHHPCRPASPSRMASLNSPLRSRDTHRHPPAGSIPGDRRWADVALDQVGPGSRGGRHRAADVWLPLDDLRDALSKLPGEPLTPTDVEQRINALRCEHGGHAHAPDEELKAAAFAAYAEEKAKGTEFIAIMGRLEEWTWGAEERLRRRREPCAASSAPDRPTGSVEDTTNSETTFALDPITTNTFPPRAADYSSCPAL
jgi:hypothetical protein